MADRKMARLERGRIEPIYAILDAEAAQRRGLTVTNAALEMREAGVRLLQYRDKLASPEELLRNAGAIADIFAHAEATLILNDWPEGCVLAGWHGVHVGQQDGSVEQARAVVGPGRLVGVSTHTSSQVIAADKTTADYVAVGPVYGTQSKADAETVIGLDGVRQARLLTSKPLVAIGGIAAKTVPDVLLAGADSVAVIGALFSSSGHIGEGIELLRTACARAGSRH